MMITLVNKETLKAMVVFYHKKSLFFMTRKNIDLCLIFFFSKKENTNKQVAINLLMDKLS